MIIGETETILHYHDLYQETEDYDEFGGLFGFLRKKTPEEKQQRKEERHQNRLGRIQRRNERREIRAADPNRQARRQSLLNDIGSSISDTVTSIIGAKPYENTQGTPFTPPNVQQQPNDTNMSFGGFGGTTPKDKDKKEDDTLLYVIGGVVGLGVFALIMNHNKK